VALPVMELLAVSCAISFCAPAVKRATRRRTAQLPTNRRRA
jgi:hypothetical protein